MESVLYKRTKKVPSITLDLETLKYAYQPIYDIRTGEIFGYEALMRPEGHSPMDIVNSYAEVGMLDFIEEVSLYYGTKFFKEANLEGYLFVNSFTNACMSPEGAKKVAELGGEEMASRLVIEILEYGKLDEKKWDLKKRNCKYYGSHPLYAIDDFGADPESDRSRIEYICPNIIKIDRKFISGIDSNQKNQHLVNAMIQNLHRVDITVLAEGVETKAEYDYLLNTDIDLMQGYYLGMPKIYIM
ncbi:MAG: EAL domain-containing protein [Lachnospiraceae bacterium]|nr:EAL domain-containing protein [Lachnospiraceae bacterium]